jgi:hypothetical protein
MSTFKPGKLVDNTSLTIGDTLYRTGGNIVFVAGEEGTYYQAESDILEKMDKVIHNGILDNGMRPLMKKTRG